MRADGFRVKSADPMYALIPHFMNKRIDAMNMITLNILEQPIHDYINKKRKEGINVSHMAVIMAAYVRALSQFPQLNRFVVNKKIYHRNEISVAMVVLKSGIKGEETEGKLYFELDDTLPEINQNIENYVSQNRKQDEANSLDVWMRRLTSMSGLMSIIIGSFRFLDRHGLLPKFLLDVSPFHASLLITNLASIRTQHIYHHVYEFGTTSMSMAMGVSREVPRRDRKSGEIVHDKCIPIGCVMDERIASGSYFSSAFRYMKRYLEHPELLEQKPESIVYESEVKNFEQRWAKARKKQMKKLQKAETAR